MIKTLSTVHKQKIGFLLLFLMYTQIVIPLRAFASIKTRIENYGISTKENDQLRTNTNSKLEDNFVSTKPLFSVNKKDFDVSKALLTIPTKSEFEKAEDKEDSGPTSPESGSFKPVGTDNLVNLFTGDFSYSIPLLDVGGYPVNLFYNSGIRMEDEASWVGLGWNINPGSVNRNLRGVPDDFNGNDILEQEQNVKPNQTWGGSIGGDWELFGLKTPKVNATLGMAFNNYLGPALEIGTNISLNPIQLVSSVKSEKSALSSSLNLNLGLNLSSRSGFSLSPSINVKLFGEDSKNNLGFGVSTSYNSRSGIKDLNFSASFNRATQSSTSGFVNNSLASTSLQFARPTYIPTIRTPMEYLNVSGALEFGKGILYTASRISGKLRGYYSESKVPTEWQKQKKPLYGYIFSNKAFQDKNGVMDFSRINDGAVTPNTPVIASTQYAYDVFSIQGEGTGGTIRAFRNDIGFMKDNETGSKDFSASVGIDIGVAAHFGGDYSIISTPTYVGNWKGSSNQLNSSLAFSSQQSNTSYENVYFKNPGETTVSNESYIGKVGEDNLVRFKLDGPNHNVIAQSQLQQFNKNIANQFIGNISINNFSNLNLARDKRSQVITMLNAEDASKVGLCTNLENYNSSNLLSLNPINNLYTLNKSILPRVSDLRKKHHISEINVLEASGMRYVFGLPVYNLEQKDYTFSTASNGNQQTGLVAYNTTEIDLSSPLINNSSDFDGYYNMQLTPGYATSFLITGLLSPDYVDITNNGITEDDLGNGVKFNYKQSENTHQWRTPRSKNNTSNIAQFNEGLKSEAKDNKAIISTGKREVWYLNSIESKTMIAIFTTGSRKDAKGVLDFNGVRNDNEEANKRLDKIDLYSKADLAKNGLSGAKPIKTVNFEYDYVLCSNVPDNNGIAEIVNGVNVNARNGKLTLRKVFFTYNNQQSGSKDRYVFKYGNEDSKLDNPDYQTLASDRWGTYKNSNQTNTNPAANPGGLSNAEYPFTLNGKPVNDAYAGAWSLKSILLPSGGKMDVTYEADDYGYVQNKVAANMYKIIGFTNSLANTPQPKLYNFNTDNNFVIIELNDPIVATTATEQKQEIYEKYLKGVNQLCFKLNVFMGATGVMEPLTVYSEFVDYGVSTSNNRIYINLKSNNDNKNLVAKASIDFLTESLPAKAFPGYEVKGSAIEAFLAMVGSMLSSLANAFTNKEQQMRNGNKASFVDVSKSFVRLCNPKRTKFGGGHRVKEVTISDSWDQMTNQYLSRYGSSYDYTTNEIINGQNVTISSGVASYEPGIGSEENPFREAINFESNLPMASSISGSIEAPYLDAYFPSPSVGYSKVTVRSIHNKNTIPADKALRSGIGKQVTQFYTAKDFPTFYTATEMDSRYHTYNSGWDLFNKEIINNRTISQGFLVQTNDMHGKKKSQEAFSEGDEKTPLSGSYHTYKNTGKNGLNDKVDFIQQKSGIVRKGLIGVDIELMTDAREHRVYSNGLNGQAQTDILAIAPPIALFTLLPLNTINEERYRAISTTKLVNFHAIEDVVTVMDKGSVISTQTIAYDAETGNPIVTKTGNEFKDPIYNVSYPAYWAYSSMEPAYKNIDRIFEGVNFEGGRITTGVTDINNVFESGDELYITKVVPTSNYCENDLSSGDALKLWVYDINKNQTAQTVASTNKNLIFMDKAGKPFTKYNVSFRIIRSGKRNLLGNSVATLSMMENPIVNNELAPPRTKIVNATAIEYKEKWQTDADVFFKGAYVTDPNTCTTTLEASCAPGAADEPTINPYLKGLVGNIKPYKNLVFYGDRTESNVSPNTTNIRNNGYLASFTPYWDFQINTTTTPPREDVLFIVNTTNWQWKSKITKVNAKGQELEMVDPLGIYTSAQNGYAKNLPLAVVSNSKYNEAAFNGFEDNNYKETINGAMPLNVCDNSHLPLNLNSNFTIVNAAAENINAHTGNQMLKLQGGNSAANNWTITTLPANPTPPVNDNQYFSIPYNTSTLNCYTLPPKGGNIDAIYDYLGNSIPSQCFTNSTSTPYFDPSINSMPDNELQFLIPGYLGLQLPGTPDPGYSHTLPKSITCNSNAYTFANSYPTANADCKTELRATFNISTFFVINEEFRHTINVTLSYLNQTSIPVSGVLNANFRLINLENNNEVDNSMTSGSKFLTDQNPYNIYRTLCLKKGKYKIEISYIIDESFITEGNCSPITPTSVEPNFIAFLNHLKIKVHKEFETGNNLPLYPSLTGSQARPPIISVQPLAVNNAMKNPTFSVQEGQKMLLSTWVKESCPSNPCNLANYTNSQVQIRFRNSTGLINIPTVSSNVLTATPTGAIIEGWQKIEQDFIVPTGATTMELTFVNNATTPNYWDDLRLHPFNANMKSYVYNPINLRITAELDENNYATFYEYDEEGQLIRVKKETAQGIKTIKETRSSKQKNITTF
jgi:hypothetical protein